MYYPESDILLRSNPEYESYIIQLDKLLGTMGHNGGKQLKIDIISDITGIKLEIIEFIFDYYCTTGILKVKMYIQCQKESDPLIEIDDFHQGKLPMKEFCDICGTEHVFTREDLTRRYSLNDTKNEAVKENPDNSNRTQSIDDEIESIDVTFKEIYISKRTNDVVRIADVQLDFKLSDKFPPEVIDKETTRTKIIKALDEAKKYNVDIICFPELCVCEEWLDDIKMNYSSIAIVAGTYYDQANHNICKLLIDSSESVPNQTKIKPSEFENPIVTGHGMVSGDKIYIYETKFGKISVLICRDFGNFIGQLSDKIDIVFVPSYNESPNRFEEIAHIHVSNYPSYIIISNASMFGGTSIFGQIDKAYFKKLEQEGFKRKNTYNFKLCEIEEGKEGLIIADFDIDHKGVQKPTPIDPSKAKRSVINIKKIDFKDN